jgi:hypothetical protein
LAIDLSKEYYNREYLVKHHDVAFQAESPNYNALARCCWFLFGGIDPDIGAAAAKFLPKLEKNLLTPSFIVDERMTFIFRNPEETDARARMA